MLMFYPRSLRKMRLNLSLLRSVPTLKQPSLRCQSHSSSSSAPSVDSGEIEKFGRLSSEWADERGPFAALHTLNKLRVPWMLKAIRKNGSLSSQSVIDIGSGGGILSVPLARSGLTVTGIDATAEAVEAAKEALETPILKRSGVALRISYHNTTAEEYASKHENAFDAVIASEIVEHVASASSFVEACCRLAKPGAPLFFTTINRTWLSRVAAVWLAEDVLRIVPQGVHDWNKFISPEELTQLLHENGCAVRFVNGFTYHPIGNHWDWLSTNKLNYALMAQKL